MTESLSPNRRDRPVIDVTPAMVDAGGYALLGEMECEDPYRAAEIVLRTVLASFDESETGKDK